MSITLITTYYNLNKYETRPKDRTKKNYLDWGEFVLKLDINLVFFVDNDIHSYIIKKRKQYNLLKKTLVICREYDQLTWSGKNPDIQKYIDEKKINYKKSFKNGAAYYTLTWNKLYMVEEIISLNPFNTEYFGWIDFGIYRVVKNDLPPKLDDNFFIPNDKKMHIMELEWTSDSEISDLQKFAGEIKFKIPAGFIVGHVTAFNKFISLFKKYLYQLLSQRIVVLEEIIFAIIYNQHEHLFTPFYGNYYHLLINYKKTNVVCKWMFHNIEHCRLQKCWKHINTVCSKIYSDAYHTMTPEQRFNLFDKWTLSSYYYNKDISQNHMELWINKLEKDPEQLKFVLKHQERILKNISYYERGLEFTKIMIGLIKN